MADVKYIYVAAPRRTRYNELNPESAVVIMERDPRHPENPAFNSPRGEICIDEGHGVDGDPARAKSPGGNPPWKVYPTEGIMNAIGRRALVEVQLRQDTKSLGMSPDDIGSLECLAPRQVAALRKGGVATVSELVAQVDKADSPLAYLTGMSGIGKPTALAIRVELVGRGLIEDIDW